MPSVAALREAFSFTPTALLELWTLDGTAVGLDTIYRFVNSSNGLCQPVAVNSVTYTPFPIHIEGMEADGKGGLPRPKLSVSNVNGFVSQLLLSNGRSLDGATVTRQRINARFIDASNWSAQGRPSWNTPDPTAAHAPEAFQINRKVMENPQIVQWELASSLETQGARLPKNIVTANACVNHKYRQSGTCNYSGAPVADVANRSFTGSIYNMTLNDRGPYDETAAYNRGDYVYVTSTLPQFAGIKIYWVCQRNNTLGVTPSNGVASVWVSDSCSKTVAGCKLRFPNVPLRTSAFPGAARAGWLSRS